MEDGAKSASQLIHTSNCRSATCQVTDGFDSASWRNWTRWLAEINSLAGENEVAGGREWNSHLVVSQPLSNCWNRQFWKCLSASQTAGSATAYPALLIGIYSMYMLYQYYIMQHTCLVHRCVSLSLKYVSLTYDQMQPPLYCHLK